MKTDLYCMHACDIFKICIRDTSPQIFGYKNVQSKSLGRNVVNVHSDIPFSPLLNACSKKQKCIHVDCHTRQDSTLILA